MYIYYIHTYAYTHNMYIANSPNGYSFAVCILKSSSQFFRYTDPVFVAWPPWPCHSKEATCGSNEDSGSLSFSKRIYRQALRWAIGLTSFLSILRNLE